MRAMQMVAQECDRMTAEYTALLGLVAKAKAGEVDLRDVTVDLLGLGWQHAPGSGGKPAEAAALVSPEPVPTIEVDARDLADLLRARAAGMCGKGGRDVVLSGTNGEPASE
jgi:hypothetical protein